MLELTETKIRKWAAKINVENLALAEQDIRLLEILKEIYSDKFLAAHLYLKGGTAINKLYIGKTQRLSVDLDFNIVGDKETVFRNRNKIRDRILKLLEKSDPEYKIKFRSAYEATHIRAQYKPLFGEPLQHIKIELSTVERFPILEPTSRRLSSHDGKIVNVSTYQLEELTATKLRALYGRLKGRDVYDLYHISSKELNKVLVRKLLLYYLYRERIIFEPKKFFESIKRKFKAKDYVDDLSYFIRATESFSMQKYIRRIIAFYSCLRELDKRDSDFILLARYLLGRNIAKEIMGKIKSIEYPLRELFGKIRISAQARNMRVDDIRIWKE